MDKSNSMMSIHKLPSVLDRAQSAYLTEEDYETCLELVDSDGWTYQIGERRHNNDGSSDFQEALAVMVNEWKPNAFRTGWIKPNGKWDKEKTEEGAS